MTATAAHDSATMTAWFTFRRSTALADARLLARPLPSFARVRVGADIAVPAVAPASAMAPAPASYVPSTARFNLPNAITLSGYGATIAWLAGGPWWLAVYSLVADEIDGEVARSTGQTSNFGSLLDWAVDLSLTALILVKLGAPWLLLAITPVQVYLRERGWTPSCGSARAFLTVVALAKG